MDWICHKCRTPNESRSGICNSCFTIKTGGERQVESEKDKLVAQHATLDAPTVFQRFFSWQHRMTRSDFIAVVLAIVGALALLVRGEISGSFSVQSPLFVLLALYAGAAWIFFAATKRCRDLDIHPLWGILCIGTAFGIVGLIFFPGTKGANQYGADSRKQKTS